MPTTDWMLARDVLIVQAVRMPVSSGESRATPPLPQLAGRVYPRVYPVHRSRLDIHQLLLRAVEDSGGTVLYASAADFAPVYLGVQGADRERLGILIYPFRMTSRVTRNRPVDEIRGQIRYGGERSWLEDHPIGRDIAGVDITILLGVDVEGRTFVGLQPDLYDPLPMGISFYAKQTELDQSAGTGWHVWERENKSGSRRPSPRARTGLETMVAFQPNRLLEYARFERQATDLSLDQSLRFRAANALGNYSGQRTSMREVAHRLEEEFSLTSEEILEIISTRNRLQVAVRGGVAEHHLERLLRSDDQVVRVERLDQDAQHDFNVWLNDGNSMRIECKNASPEAYSDGDFKVEVQKTRASKNDPLSRYYRIDQFDVVAACMYSPTGHWTFRFRKSQDMVRNRADHERLAAIQRIDVAWATSLAELA